MQVARECVCFVYIFVQIRRTCDEKLVLFWFLCAVGRSRLFFFSIRLCPDNLFRSVPLVRADEATVEVQDQVLDSMDNG